MLEFFDYIKSPSKLRTGFFVLLIIYSLIVFVYGTYGALRGSSDLKSFYATSELLLNKTNPYELTIQYIEREGYNLSFAGLEKAGGITMYPPSTHLLFIPFYAFLLSPDIACVSWLLWNIVFLGIIYWFLCSRYKGDIRGGYAYLLIFMLIGAASTKTNLSLGQTTLFSLAAFVLSLSLQDRSKWLSGFAFALAVSKPSLMILFVFYLLFKKEFRILIIAFFIHLALTVGISIWIGQSPLTLMQSYFKLIGLLTTQDSAMSYYYQMAGVSFKTSMKILGCSPFIVTLATVVLYFSAIIYMYQQRSLDEKRSHRPLDDTH
jgi:Glycosyltransferase family 87